MGEPARELRSLRERAWVRCAGEPVGTTNDANVESRVAHILSPYISLCVCHSLSLFLSFTLHAAGRSPTLTHQPKTLGRSRREWRRLGCHLGRAAGTPGRLILADSLASGPVHFDACTAKSIDKGYRSPEIVALRAHLRTALAKARPANRMATEGPQTLPRDVCEVRRALHAANLPLGLQ